MRKIVLAFTLAFGLSGCAGLNLAFQSTTNPVTKDMLYEVENGMTIAFAALNTYRRSCNQGLIPVSCKQTIAKIRVYTIQIPPLLKALRTFVKTNDQVNAVVIYNTIVGLVTSFKAEAAASGVVVGVN